MGVYAAEPRHTADCLHRAAGTGSGILATKMGVNDAESNSVKAASSRPTQQLVTPSQAVAQAHSLIVAS